MRKLSITELLDLQDMILEAELRCQRRAAEAQVKADYRTAAYEIQTAERYGSLKFAILEELHGRGNHPSDRSVRELHARAGHAPSGSPALRREEKAA